MLLKDVVNNKSIDLDVVKFKETDLGWLYTKPYYKICYKFKCYIKKICGDNKCLIISRRSTSRWVIHQHKSSSVPKLDWLIKKSIQLQIKKYL